MSLSKIIELLEQDNVRRAIQEDNLDTVYEEAIRKTMDLSELTSFFESKGIAPLDYVATVYQFMYSHNEAVSIRLHDNIKVIDSDGFAYCKVLQNIVIPDSVTEIENYVTPGETSLAYNSTSCSYIFTKNYVESCDVYIQHTEAQRAQRVLLLRALCASVLNQPYAPLPLFSGFASHDRRP